jgi:hypothetical protein
MEKARRGAQAELDASPPAPDDPQYVYLAPQELSVRPELFQPREFTYGVREVNKRHVEQLKREIERVGELDPILVIRLGRAWVCVDGHHRLAAYQKLKWKPKVKCEWFKGSVWDAVDAGMRTNAKIKLNMQQEDKFENAWKRVVLRHGSKSEISKTCAVSETTIAGMRRAMRAFTEGPQAKDLQRKLGQELEDASWWKIRQIWLGHEEKEIDKKARIRERAAALAKGLTSRMEDRLSRNPEVTAMALKLYDAELIDPLTEALIALRKNEQKTEQAVEDKGAYEALNEQYEAKMQERTEQHRTRSTNGGA